VISSTARIAPPAIRAAARLAARALDTAGARAALLRLGTAESRHRLEREAWQAFQQASVVLFVCKGNVCRSPFAEHLATSRLEGTRVVRSAGYLLPAGRPSPDTAREAAARWGVDLRRHAALCLTDQLARTAGVVFVFDNANRRRLLRDYPYLRRRVHFLGSLRPEGPLFIADPWDADAETYGRIYGDIAAVIERLAARMPATVQA
jgi:protein-tyrosine phosphatase